jgi:tetratricopeptide (TPR) repeat protein
VLYALHPLRVESVAWATERRDVLSGALLLGSVGAYLRWTSGEDPRWRRAALVAFALSLLSKTSGFVLPLVLLCLDAYPLGRLRPGPDGRRPWAERLREKKVWFAMGALAAWVALLGQLRAPGAVSTLAEVDLFQRAGLSLSGLSFHVVRTLWPAGLAALHPLDQAPALTDGRTLLGALALLVITATALARRRRAPGLLVGWLIYLMCLLPVVGIVHVGVHFAADRYGYLATMPFAAFVAALVLDLSRGPRARALVLAVGAALALLLGGATWRQVGYWRDSVTLWARVAAVHPASHVGHHRLGVALLEAGRAGAASASFERALELRPDPVGESARYDLAEAQWALGDGPAALASVELVLAAEPTHLHCLLLAEEIHVRAGAPELALALYARALAADPTDLPARVRRSHLLREQLADAPAALAEARRAVALDPNSDAARAALGLALLTTGDAAEAEGHLRLALALAPGNRGLLEALAASLTAQGRADEAALVRARIGP